jgi:hypothetical protein
VLVALDFVYPSLLQYAGEVDEVDIGEVGRLVCGSAQDLY